MNQIIDKFIILKKIKFGESDLIIHALGSDGAKSSFMARGALRSKKRFGGGVLEPMHFVSLSYKETTEPGKIKNLLEASLIDDFKDIRLDYDKLELAFYILGCVSKVSLEGDQNSEFLFNLTGHILRAIAVACDLQVLKMQFCLKFLYQQGVISFAPWMSMFLKTNISDSLLIQEDLQIKEIAHSQIYQIEVLVDQYVRTASTS